MLVRKGQFLFTCRLAGCWKRRLHRVSLISTWFTIKKASNFCFVFCLLNVLYHFFALPYHTKKNYVGVFLCHSSRMLFRNPLDETGLKKRKTKTIPSTHSGNLPKVPLLFYSLRNRSNLGMWQRIGSERRICLYNFITFLARWPATFQEISSPSSP